MKRVFLGCKLTELQFICLVEHVLFFVVQIIKVVDSCGGGGGDELFIKMSFSTQFKELQRGRGARRRGGDGEALIYPFHEFDRKNGVFSNAEENTRQRCEEETELHPVAAPPTHIQPS